MTLLRPEAAPWVSSIARAPVYELRAVVYDLPDGIFTRDYGGPAMQFLWRPSPAAFASLANSHRLPVFEFLVPATLGIILQSGGSRPRAVAYDRNHAIELYRKSYQDSSVLSEKRARRDATGFFHAQIESLDLGPNTPVFLRGA